MSVAFQWRPALLGFIFIACSNASGAGPQPTASADAGEDLPSLHFDRDGVLTVAVGERVMVGLVVPPGMVDVPVWLDGVYGDASLDTTDVIARDGRGTFLLRAPSAPAYFSLRAGIEGNTAELRVSASAAGFADVRLMPTYEGRRPTPVVVGSIFIGTSCAALSAAPIQDGAAVVQGALDTPLLLARIPASTALAVSARIGHYTSGCVDVNGLSPDATQDVPLALHDRPMDLQSTHLQAVLAFDPDTTARDAWTAMLTDAETKANAAFLPGAAGVQAKALLDAMHDAVPPGPAAPPTYDAQFSAARSKDGWDGKTTAWLDARAPLPHDRAATWMAAGRGTVFGDMVVRLDAPQQDTGAGLTAFTLQRLGGVDTTVGGFGSWEFGWTADPDDSVRLAGTMHFRPTTLMTLAADMQAKTAVTSARDVPAALAVQLDCAGLASVLVGTGTSYAGCDAACTARLCAAGFAGAWRAAASASEEVQFGISASGQAQVGDRAEPIGFLGEWLGQVGASGGSAAFSVSGRATATYSPPP